MRSMWTNPLGLSLTPIVHDVDEMEVQLYTHCNVMSYMKSFSRQQKDIRFYTFRVRDTFLRVKCEIQSFKVRTVVTVAVTITAASQTTKYIYRSRPAELEARSRK